MLSFNLAINTVLKGSMVFMVSMINALQFIFHLPIMSIVFPANIMGFFRTMIPVVMFDVLSDLPYLEDLFTESDATAEQNNIREQVFDLGYSSHNPLLNLKTLTAL